MASVSNGAYVATSGDLVRSTWRVSAPMVRTSPFAAMPRSSASSPTSIISSGEIKRRFIAGIRLWPPDSSFALSPCATSNSSAFVTLVARAYAKAEAFIGVTFPGRILTYFVGLDGGDHQRSSLFIDRLFREIRLLDLWYRGRRRTVWRAPNPPREEQAMN